MTPGSGAHPALVALPAAVAGAIAATLAAASGTGIDATVGVGAAVVLAWALGGAAVAVRRPLCRLGALLLAGTELGSLWLLALAGHRAGGGWTTSDALVWAGALAAGTLPAVAFHLLVVLPSGRVARPGERWLLGGGYAAGLAVGVVAAADGRLPGTGATVALWLVAVAAGLVPAHRRYLAATGTERQRLQWVGCGAVLALEVVLIAFGLDLLIGWPAHPGAAALGASVLVPAAFAAGASPRLVARADRLLLHTVSITGLTAVTTGTYVVVVLGLGRAPDDTDRAVLGLSMGAAAVAALLHVPARDRIGTLANRIVYGERHAPDEVLRTFGSRLSRSIPMDELLLQLAESLKKTLTLSRAEVWTGTADLLERTVSVPFGDPRKLVVGEAERPVVARSGVTGQAWAAVWLPELLEGRSAVQLRIAPAVHSGELLGLLVVERPADDDAFTVDDDTMLTELARQVGLALHNVQLDSALQATLAEVRRANEDLRASRARIVAAGDAERRKIERNLHDGAQQHLVALAVNLRLMKDVVGEDPATAVEMLEQLAADVKETIAELRSLAHGIFPPLLVDAGLPDALRAAASRSPLDVDVAVSTSGRYDPEVEAAVYFCCLEALQNAAKHAPGSQVTVEVVEDGGTLRFLVRDDGPGLDAAALGTGHGFVNMSDRLGAIGGTVQWDSEPGAGTRISGSVPVT